MNAGEFFSYLWDGFYKKKTKKLGSGRYNKAFLIQEPLIIDDFEAFWVVKEPRIFRSHRIKINDASRAARKWSEINPSFPVHLAYPYFWVVPYLGNDTPNDELIQECIIDIYRRTGNIIADGCKSDNFVKFENKAVCIDMDLAVRRNSIVSDEYYNNTVRHQVFTDFINTQESTAQFPLTIQTIKTLFFLEDCLASNDFDYQDISAWVLQYLDLFQQKLIFISKVALQTLINFETKKISDCEFEKLLKPEILSCLDKSDLELDLVDLKARLITVETSLQQQLNQNKSCLDDSITDYEYTSVRDSDSSMGSVESPFKIGSYSSVGFFMGLNQRIPEELTSANIFSV